MLTDRQKQLLEYIHWYLDGNKNTPPTFEEMKEAMNLKSKAGIHRLLTGLEERGYIRRLRARARAIELTGKYQVCDNVKCPRCHLDFSVGEGKKFKKIYKDC